MIDQDNIIHLPEYRDIQFRPIEVDYEYDHFEEMCGNGECEYTTVIIEEIDYRKQYKYFITEISESQQVSDDIVKYVKKLVDSSKLLEEIKK